MNGYDVAASEFATKDVILRDTKVAALDSSDHHHGHYHNVSLMRRNAKNNGHGIFFRVQPNHPKNVNGEIKECSALFPTKAPLEKKILQTPSQSVYGLIVQYIYSGRSMTLFNTIVPYIFFSVKEKKRQNGGFVNRVFKQPGKRIIDLRRTKKEERAPGAGENLFARARPPAHVPSGARRSGESLVPKACLAKKKWRKKKRERVCERGKKEIFAEVKPIRGGTPIKTATILCCSSSSFLSMAADEVYYNQ